MDGSGPAFPLGVLVAAIGFGIPFLLWLSDKLLGDPWPLDFESWDAADKLKSEEPNAD